MDTHAPLRVRSVVDHPNHPWINQEILDMKRERRKAEKRMKTPGLNEEDTTKAKKEYRDLCHNVKDLVESARSDFYAQQIQECEGDQKKLYKVIDCLMGREKPKALPTSSSNLVLAGTLNNFFISKITNIHEDLNSLKSTTADMSFQNLYSILKSCASPLDSFAEASVEEVAKIICESSRATCLLDPMPTALVKETFLQLAPFITHIVNLALSSGTFPSKLKSAIVHPLIKKPNLDCEILKNYRPVSNLSFLSKVIEKVIASRLLEHMQSNNLLETLQSAYKKAHSTETALLRVQNDILSSINTRKGSFLILLDLSAAFDTVDHELLLSFLDTHIGLRGPVLSLFRSYLCGRSQCVSVNGVMSEFCQLAFGVPQGSVLGPLVFCTYTLPLGAILRHHELDYHLYADDTQVYCATDLSEPKENLARIIACVSDIRTWRVHNKLKINDDKTEFLILHSAYIDLTHNLEFQVGQEKIKPSNSCRNLGVMFDSHMKLEDQVQSICKSVNFHLRSIRSVRNSLTDEATAQLVHSLITSRLDYCNSLLYGLPDTLIIRLQRLQNIAARIVACCPKAEHITPVLYKLHWLPVRMRILFKLLLVVYKCVQKLAPAYLCELVQPKHKTKYGLRGDLLDLLHIPRSQNVTYGDRAFSVCGPTEWNRIPLDIRHSESVAIFKTRLKTLLLQSTSDE